MNLPITYSLRNKGSSFAGYYEDISKFADEVMSVMDVNFGDIIRPFMDYVIQNGFENIRSKEEYELELLAIGVLWREYINKAVVLKDSSSRLLSWFAEKRKNGFLSKALSDYIRGILETILLLKTDNITEDLAASSDNFKKLIKWLSASGNFLFYVKRLKLWEEFLNAQEKQMVTQYLHNVLETAEWFEKKSVDDIGIYTNNVEEYLKKEYLSHKWKEDIIYCGAGRIQYHLNMVGAEILNREFRGKFRETKEKWILLPACMRANYGKKCRAEETQNGYNCRQCTSKCNVNILTQMGKKYEFKVFIIPHESTPFTNTEIKSGEIGIIGIACVLNLISGGWKAVDLGFVPQCVLLEYSGCKAHWSKTGVPTQINFERLLDTLDIKCLK